MVTWESWGYLLGETTTGLTLKVQLVPSTEAPVQVRFTGWLKPQREVTVTFMVVD